MKASELLTLTAPLTIKYRGKDLFEIEYFCEMYFDEDVQARFAALRDESNELKRRSDAAAAEFAAAVTAARERAAEAAGADEAQAELEAVIERARLAVDALAAEAKAITRRDCELTASLIASWKLTDDADAEMPVSADYLVEMRRRNPAVYRSLCAQMAEDAYRPLRPAR